MEIDSSSSSQYDQGRESKEDSNHNTDEPKSRPVLKFRNYIPNDKNLRQFLVYKPINLDQKTDSNNNNNNRKNKKNDQPDRKRQKTKGDDEDDDEEEEGEGDEDDSNQKEEKDGDHEAAVLRKYSRSLPSQAASTYALVEEFSKLNPHEMLEKALAKYANQEPGTNLVARKINWDLKEEIAPKLEKLKKRTQKAIVEILREKYAHDNDNDNDNENDESDNHEK